MPDASFFPDRLPTDIDRDAFATLWALLPQSQRTALLDIVQRTSTTVESNDVTAHAHTLSFSEPALQHLLELVLAPRAQRSRPASLPIPDGWTKAAMFEPFELVLLDDPSTVVHQTYARRFADSNKLDQLVIEGPADSTRVAASIASLVLRRVSKPRPEIDYEDVPLGLSQPASSLPPEIQKRIRTIFEGIRSDEVQTVSGLGEGRLATVWLAGRRRL
jgi:hypothetical protein